MATQVSGGMRHPSGRLARGDLHSYTNIHAQCMQLLPGGSFFFFFFLHLILPTRRGVLLLYAAVMICVVLCVLLFPRWILLRTWLWAARGDTSCCIPSSVQVKFQIVTQCQDRWGSIAKSERFIICCGLWSDGR